MQAFLTGSQTYTKPTETSDVDLVIYTDEQTKQKIIELSDTGKMPCKYGKLNIIFVTTPDEWAAWYSAKQRRIKEEVESRDEAYKIHKQQRDLFNVTFDHDSGPKE